MGQQVPITRDPHSEDFDAVVTYLAAVSRRLSSAELLEVTDTLHDLIRLRKWRRFSKALASYPQPHGRNPFAR